ncbi:MAG: serine/threonine-protein kinase, partial [Acidobacteriota bacterium]
MLDPGSLLDGRYEIVGPLGAGGMGQVYRAKRPLLGDEVAVKVLHQTVDAPSGSRQRFLRESRACAHLRHPNIVTILDFNVDPSGLPYLVMELLSGPSLRDEIEMTGAMAPHDAADIIARVAAALQMAHDRGITHRDLKPANIVAHRFESGERVYKVIDFGLAAVKAASDDIRLTDPHTFLGTMAYAAPEQLRGETSDPRTDIYTLGVIAYEMLTGRRPFDTDDRMSLITQTLTAPPPGLRQLRPELTDAIENVVMRALEKGPESRWPSVAAFARAFQDAVGSVQTTVRGAASGDGAVLARYDLGDVIGQGRLGSLVYRASHRALGLPVAIRVLRRANQSNWEAIRGRFLKEARTLQVAHPNLLQVRDFGEDDRLVFMVTDLVEGPSLRAELAKGVFDWSRTALLLRQMLDATAALNADGGFIVGVNPDMIRLCRDEQGEQVLMSTAGLASVQDLLATLKDQDLRGGEVNDRELPYVAPELLLGRNPDSAADVFTIGVIAYQMTTGRVPFRAPSLPELIGQMLQTRLVTPRAVNPQVPERASDAIVRALSPDTSPRPAGAAA